MVAAGWYQDPYDPAQLRWWDGVRWTEHAAAGPGAVRPGDGGYAVAPGTMAGGAHGAGAQPAMWAQQPVGTNGMAIASMVLGIVWLYWLGSLLAVIFGHVSLNQIKRTGGSQGGRGMAIAGLVLGYLGLGVLLIVVLAVSSADSSGYYG